MGGLGFLPLLAALGIPASLGARRYGRPCAMVVTVRGDSILHAEKAVRCGLLTVTDVAFTCGLPPVAERDADGYDRLRTAGAVPIGGSRIVSHGEIPRAQRRAATVRTHQLR